MTKNLLIVESPAKAKTIEKYLGKEFTVKSSYGHVRDLSKDKKGVDVDNGFKPNYVISKDKTKVVKELKDWVKKSDEVWLATDEDREGEAISWHLCKVLGLPEETTKRIVFREITKDALQKAIQTPRTVDVNLVNAQQARRVLDRLVGFELSELLWRKVKGKLSAGRVQSVAVKLIVERERSIQAFEVTPYFKVIAIFDVKGANGRTVKLKADLKERLADEKSAQQFLEDCKSASFDISNITVKPTKRNPAAPFTTSTMQQEASRKLGFSVARTMSTAQRLYEQGHITYMRTDSTSLSNQAMGMIANLIEQDYGKQYLQTRRYKSKNSNAQEAHEAIRPTNFNKHQVSNDRDQQRLYDLIWKRAVASQMASAQLEKTTVDIAVSTRPDAAFVAKGEVLKFDGFLKVYIEGTDDESDDDEQGILPPLSVGQILPLNTMTATQRFTRPPARYTEAALVKKLEELGIGRPSTYAPIISKITQSDKGYILKDPKEGVERHYEVLELKQGAIKKETKTEITGAEKNKLYPSDMGMLVSDFLGEHFEDIMEYRFTADMENQFDKIASGRVKWTDLIGDFYTPFHQHVQKTLEEADRVTGERKLGKDPKSGRTVLVRMSRFGPVAQIGAQDELEEEEKPAYANLKPGQSLETVTFEEALELFKLPKDLGEFDGLPVSIGAGRYGPYVKYDGKFVSLKKGMDPLETTLDQAIELIKEKQKADAPVAEYQGEPITKGAGRFGPFLKWKGMFVNIPKKYDPENLSFEEMKELIDAKVEKEANRYIHNWDKEKISVQNGRWGPFIKFGKKNVKLPKVNGERYTKEMALELTLEQVKALIEAELPGSFKEKKKAAPKKKSATKKKATKK
ncbi:MAG: type I DNA topoisomerase [Bacteroidota bacterium]